MDIEIWKKVYQICLKDPFNLDSNPVVIAHVFDVSISAGRELDGDSRGYRSAEEQARELTRSIRREVNKLSEQWNALIERSDAWKRKLDDTANVSTLPSFYVHRKPLTLEPHYPIWIQIFWFRRKPLDGLDHRWGNKLSMVCAPVSIKLPHNFDIHLPQEYSSRRNSSKFLLPVRIIHPLYSYILHLRLEITGNCNNFRDMIRLLLLLLLLFILYQLRLKVGKFRDILNYLCSKLINQSHILAREQVPPELFKISPSFHSSGYTRLKSWNAPV